MVDSIADTTSGLNAAHDHLDGATNSAWHDFQLTANQQTGALNDDFTNGIKALEQIRMILVEADNNGSRRF
jgi:hypothetical protein